MNTIETKFQIISQIGQGAFCTVFKVKRIKDGQIYALKKIPFKDLKEKEVENALNEVRILASIDHPYVVGFKEVFIETNGENLCLVMEFAENGDLAQKIKLLKQNKKRFSEEKVIRYFYQLVLALNELHQKSVIHRDLKTANIFLHSNYKDIKLGDMNVSKIVKNFFAHTQTGTPYYASPEVWRDEAYSTKTDIWSLGCVIFEMCMLKPPFQANSLDELFEKVQGRKMMPFDDFYSPSLKKSILSLLQTNFRERPTCVEILQYPIFDKIKEKIEKKLRKSFQNELIQTIKADLNFQSLAQRLPSATYHKDSSQNFSNLDIRKDSKNMNFLKNKSNIEKNIDSSLSYSLLINEIKRQPQKNEHIRIKTENRNDSNISNKKIITIRQNKSMKNPTHNNYNLKKLHSQKQIIMQTNSKKKGDSKKREQRQEQIKKQINRLKKVLVTQKSNVNNIINKKPLFVDSLNENNISNRIKIIQNSLRNITSTHTTRNVSSISEKKQLYQTRRKTLNPVLKSKKDYLENYLKKKFQTKDSCSFLEPKQSLQKSQIKNKSKIIKVSEPIDKEKNICINLSLNQNLCIKLEDQKGKQFKIKKIINLLKSQRNSKIALQSRVNQIIKFIRQNFHIIIFFIFNFALNIILLISSFRFQSQLIIMQNNPDTKIKACKKLLSNSDLSSDERYNYLLELKRIPMNKERLVKHQIHLLVGKFAKNKKGQYSKRVSQLANEIREMWKKILLGFVSQSQEQKNDTKENKTIDPKDETCSHPIPEFEDKMREKFYKQLLKKFQELNIDNDQEKLYNFVQELEEALYQEAKKLEEPYVKLVRQKWLVLSDKENSSIGQRLFERNLSIQDFVEKNPKDLLENKKMQEMLEEAAKYNMEALQEDFYLKNSDLKEGEFQCGKCKNRKIITFQKQMRSADEPMTTFFHCVKCDNRWKN